VVPPTINEKGGADCNPASEVDVQNYDQATRGSTDQGKGMRDGKDNRLCCHGESGANLDTGLFAAEYRLNGPRILSRISEIVRFGGLSRIATPEARGSIGLPIISSISFSHCCE
jgi:hypothetical protein